MLDLLRGYSNVELNVYGKSVIKFVLWSESVEKSLNGSYMIFSHLKPSLMNRPAEEDVMALNVG